MEWINRNVVLFDVTETNNLVVQWQKINTNLFIL